MDRPLRFILALSLLAAAGAKKPAPPKGSPWTAAFEGVAVPLLTPLTAQGKAVDLEALRGCELHPAQRCCLTCRIAVEAEP